MMRKSHICGKQEGGMIPFFKGYRDSPRKDKDPFIYLRIPVFHYASLAFQRNREWNNDKRYEATVSQKPGLDLYNQHDLK